MIEVTMSGEQELNMIFPAECIQNSRDGIDVRFVRHELSSLVDRDFEVETLGRVYECILCHLPKPPGIGS